MGGSRPVRLLAGSVALSLAAHIAVALFADGVDVADGADDQSRKGRSAASAPLALAWADEEPPPKPAAPKEEPTPAPEPPKPKEIDALLLGIAESDQDTENWMGFAEPTKHAALKSDVEQPALDPAAGTPAPPPRGQPVPPTVTAVAGSQGNAEAAAPPAAPPMPPSLPPQPVKPQRVPSDPPTSQAPEDRGTPQPDDVDPDKPLLLEGKTEIEQAEPALRAEFVGPPFEASKSEAQPDVSESVEVPPVISSPPQPPGDAAQPGKQAVIVASSVTDTPGTLPGEQSDREADAASREEAIEVRLGRPAAAKGLEIVTRRPEFSRVTRLTVYPPINPRLRVTFGRDGRVTTAKFVDPTGLAEVDSPVLNAVYRWTARGEALSKLPVENPQAGVTITVTILLR